MVKGRNNVGEDIIPMRNDPILNTGIAMLLNGERPLDRCSPVLGPDYDEGAVREVLRYDRMRRSYQEDLSNLRQAGVNIPDTSHLSGDSLYRFYRHVVERVRAELRDSEQ
jgi:hypothetical protein